MLKDELKELEREHSEGLTTQTGACIFCGQMANIETLLPWPEEKCNEAATELCDCNEAKVYVWKKKKIGKGLQIHRRTVQESRKSYQRHVAAVSCLNCG